MNNLKKIKNYAIGFIAGLATIGLVSFASEQGTIGDLFSFNSTYNQWFLKPEAIASGSITNEKIGYKSIDRMKIIDKEIIPALLSDNLRGLFNITGGSYWGSSSSTITISGSKIDSITASKITGTLSGTQIDISLKEISGSQITGKIGVDKLDYPTTNFINGATCSYSSSNGGIICLNTTTTTTSTCTEGTTRQTTSCLNNPYSASGCGWIAYNSSNYKETCVSGSWVYLLGGSSWTYSTTDNGNSCLYKCTTGYTWDGTKCIANTLINGVCGTGNGVSTTNGSAWDSSWGTLCSSGTPSTATSNSTTNKWSWSCTGANGGTTASCTANIILTSTSCTEGATRQTTTCNGDIMGASGCGWVAYGSSSYKETCSGGNWIYISGGSSWTYIDGGSYSGQNCAYYCKTGYTWDGSKCKANATTTTTCGTAATGSSYHPISAPTSNLCNGGGIVSNQRDGGSSWNWDCGSISCSIIKEYSIYFNVNGGSSLPVIYKKYNDSISSAELPTTTKAGYQFGGWYEDIGLRTQYYGTHSIQNSFTLYAKWVNTAGSVFYNSATDICGWLGSTQSNADNFCINKHGSGYKGRIESTERNNNGGTGWSDYNGTSCIQRSGPSGLIGKITCYQQ